MYHRIGVKAVMRPKPKDFVDDLNIGTYGDVLIQSTHPPQIAKKIDNFFHKCKRVEDATLVRITDVVTERGEIPLQVLDDPVVTASVREDVMRLVLSEKKGKGKRI